jgi:hypothetical protein
MIRTDAERVHRIGANQRQSSSLILPAVVPDRREHHQRGGKDRLRFNSALDSRNHGDETIILPVPVVAAIAVRHPDASGTKNTVNFACLPRDYRG